MTQQELLETIEAYDEESSEKSRIITGLKAQVIAQQKVIQELKNQLRQEEVSEVRAKVPLATLSLYNFSTLTHAGKEHVLNWIVQQHRALLEGGEIYAPVFTSTLKK